MPAALIFAAPVIAGALSRMDPMLPAKVGGAILAAGAGVIATADSMYTNMPSTPFPAWPMNSTPPIDGVRRNMYQPQPPANRQVQNQEKPTDPTSGTQRGNCKGPAQVRRYTRAGFLTRATPISPETPTP